MSAWLDGSGSHWAIKASSSKDPQCCRNDVSLIVQPPAWTQCTGTSCVMSPPVARGHYSTLIPHRYPTTPHSLQYMSHCPSPHSSSSPWPQALGSSLQSSRIMSSTNGISSHAQRIGLYTDIVCPLSATERFLSQPLVCGTVFHHTSLLPLSLHLLLSS